MVIKLGPLRVPVGWALAALSGAGALGGGFLVVRHFATTAWPLSGGEPSVLVAVGLLFLVAQALKAIGWARLFAPGERPHTLALAAGNGGAALIGTILPGRFDDAMRIAVVRRYPGCPASVRSLCLSLVMLGLIDSVALAPLALAAALLSRGGIGVRTGLAVLAAAGVAAAALILALPRLAASRRALRFRVGRWLNPRTTSRRGRGGGSAADRPRGRGHAGRRRRGGPDRIRRLGFSGARCFRRCWHPRRSLRHRDPPRCGYLADRPVAGADPGHGINDADFSLAELTTDGLRRC